MVEAEIDSLDIQLDEDVDSAVTIMHAIYFSMLFGEKNEPQPFLVFWLHTFKVIFNYCRYHNYYYPKC